MMSPEKRALKRVALAVGCAIGIGLFVGVALPILAALVTPMVLAGILMTGVLVYLINIMYDMYVHQERAKDEE